MPAREEMMRRQRLLADFGEVALRSDDPQEVLTEACRFVAEALEVDLAKILEIDHEANEALVRAGVGWNAGVVGEVRLPLGERSSETYALKHAQPVVTQDLARETRFAFPDFMRAHGVVALVNVPIFMPGGEAYGLLQVDAREPREFGEADITLLKTYATILGPIVDRLRKLDELRAERDHSAMLLRELQHRVKNDLAIIQSIIRLRARHASPGAKEELLVVGERIETLRLLYDQLYAGGSVDQLALRPYVQRLLENLATLHAAAKGPVRLEIRAADLDVAPDVAASIGLILNEFATNSFKYGVNAHGGVLAVELSKRPHGKAILSIADNGPGLPTDPSARRSGSGMTIIDALARQLGGRASWSSQEGVRLAVEFDLA